MQRSASRRTRGIGIKPVSKEGSERLIRSAIEYAIANKRKSVTLVHKGNIQKFTEGAFRNWGYQLAEREFAAQTYSWEQWERTKAAKGEKAANAEMDARKGRRTRPHQGCHRRYHSAAGAHASR